MRRVPISVNLLVVVASPSSRTPPGPTGPDIGASESGRMGDAGAWSAHLGRILGAVGDAGAVTANDPDLARTVWLLRNYGSERNTSRSREA